MINLRDYITSSGNIFVDRFDDSYPSPEETPPSDEYSEFMKIAYEMPPETIKFCWVLHGKKYKRALCVHFCGDIYVLHNNKAKAYDEVEVSAYFDDEEGYESLDWSLERVLEGFKYENEIAGPLEFEELMPTFSPLPPNAIYND